MPRSPGIPSCRLHRPSGQAVVTLAGKSHYLGAHESTHSQTAYKRLIGAWHYVKRVRCSRFNRGSKVLRFKSVCQNPGSSDTEPRPWMRNVLRSSISPHVGSSVSPAPDSDAGSAEIDRATPLLAGPVLMDPVTPVDPVAVTFGFAPV